MRPVVWQLSVLVHLERHCFPTNFLLPKLGATQTCSLDERYLVTAPEGGPPWGLLVTLIPGSPGDKLMADEASAGSLLDSLGAVLGELHCMPPPDETLRSIRDGYPVCAA